MNMQAHMIHMQTKASQVKEHAILKQFNTLLLNLPSVCSKLVPILGLTPYVAHHNQAGNQSEKSVDRGSEEEISDFCWHFYNYY